MAGFADMMSGMIPKQGWSGALQASSPMLLSMARGMQEGLGPFAYQGEGIAAMMKMQKEAETKKMLAEIFKQKAPNFTATGPATQMQDRPSFDYQDPRGEAAMTDQRHNPVLSGDIARYADATAAVESKGSGDYSAIGPVTDNGDRAYGRYQIMGNNIGPWSKKHLGREISIQEFLQTPALQDEIYQLEFGGNVEKYGSPQDAASVWFSGKPLQGNQRSDGYNTVPEYVAKFNAALDGPKPQMSATPMQAAPGGRTGGLTMERMVQIMQNPNVSPHVKAMLLKRFEAQNPTQQQQNALELQQLQLAQARDPQMTPYQEATLAADAAKAALPPKTSEAEQEIARLMETGLTREQAINIKEGRHVFRTNPVTGGNELFDANTGKPVTPRPDVEVGNLPPSIMGGADLKKATGVRGAVKNALNTLFDAVGAELPYGQTQEATTALQNLNTRTTTHMVQGVPGRPNVKLLEMFERLVSEPNSVFQGPGRTLDKLQQTRDFVQSMIDMNKAALGDPITRKSRGEAIENIRSLEALLSDYDQVLENYGSSGGEGGVAVGSGGLAPEGVDQGTWDYMTDEERAQWP